MPLTYMMFLVALSLSAIAAFYSIMGLAAIFAAAVMPVVIMGSILEVAKLMVTVWLHEYWRYAKLLMRGYLVVAVVILMIITSMGIFGFLSKAHTDQSLVSGDVQSKIAIYDEKIRTAKENIDANRKALKQLDEAVDQVMGRSTTEAGADKAVAVRRAQQAERRRLLAEIEAEQKKISSLNEERAPIAAEVRKVEAEVGPIKYIAALIYGDDLDVNLLERAVRWVIILLVCVFDPLAIMMLLAATESLKWHKDGTIVRQSRPDQDPKYPPDDGALTTEQLDQIKASAPAPAEPTNVLSYLKRPSKFFRFGVPSSDSNEEQHDLDNLDNEQIREAKRLWKLANPDKTLKDQRKLLAAGVIDKLPWMDLVRDVDFGMELPKDGIKGQLFIKITQVPSVLYKFNGSHWMPIDKSTTDQYAYNSKYIDYLVSKIESGEYDPEYLTEIEQIQIEKTLAQGNK